MDYFISLVFASVFVGRITADASPIQTCDCPWTVDQFNSLAAEVAILRADVEELRSSMTVSSNIQLDQANEIPEPNNVVGNIVYLADEEAPNPPPQPPKIDGFVYATCKPMPNSALTQELFQPITGSINMKQNASGGPLFIDVFMYGFSSAAGSKHGFHIHTYGDLKEGCQSTGGHYNPHNKNHGGPNDGDRHVGDLGNIVPNEHGVVTVAIEDSLASLVGEHSVIGRAIVIHAGEDDLGLGGYSDSLTTGHAGARLACCVIGTCEQ